MTNSQPPIWTRVAHTGTSELRFQGHSVFNELLGNVSVGQLITLGFSGRLLAADEMSVLDDILTALSSADPRLWPFKIARLAAAGGSAAYGVSSVLAGTEDGFSGPARFREAARYLMRLHARDATSPLTDGAIAESLAHQSAAFGVLYRSVDERFAALMRQAAVRGRTGFPFMTLCNRVVDVGRRTQKLEPHMSLGVAALALDLGFDDSHVYALGVLALFHCSLANATEGAQQMPRHLQIMPYDQAVVYVGHGARRSPRAVQARMKDKVSDE